MSRTPLERPSTPERLEGAAMRGCAALACLVGACQSPVTVLTPGRVSLESPAMGTSFRVVVEVPSERSSEEALAAAHVALAAIEAVERWASDWTPDSEVSRLAAQLATSTEPVAASPELTSHLSFALELAEETGGAFDPTLGQLTRLWRRAMRRAELPDPERRAAARASSGHAWVEVDREASTVRAVRPGVRFDLGGSAKGEALDRALEVLTKAGFPRALVDGGGDLRLGEAPTGTDGWVVSIRVDGGKGPPSRLELAECAVATSGDAARFALIAGTRYSHIVDPRTGLGLDVRRAATVIAPDARTADALATALVVAGRPGLAWVEARPECEGRVVEWGPHGALPCNSSGFPQDGGPHSSPLHPADDRDPR